MHPRALELPPDPEKLAAEAAPPKTGATVDASAQPRNPRGELLRRHPALRAELLREQRDAQLLDVPAQRLPLRVACPAGDRSVGQCVGERPEFAHALLVARGIVARDRKSVV